MKPTLGWTMLSREEIRQVERSLAEGEQETRDEIGFLLIHQGFADRFFPGTSVLHTRIRYALFVPWVYHHAAFHARGGDIEAKVRRLLIGLAISLKEGGRENHDVIGGDKLGHLTTQPPDRVYWGALRVWGLLLPGVESRTEALRRLRASARSAALDDDGGRLDDEPTEVFAGMPQPPEGWGDSHASLKFTLHPHEREFLRGQLLSLTRPGDEAPALLSQLVGAGVTFHDSSTQLPHDLDACADGADDRLALRVARDAAALAAIGRAVYGALVEQLLAQEGGPDDNKFRNQLRRHFDLYGTAAADCDLNAAKSLLPNLPPHVREVLRETQAYIRGNKPENFPRLLPYYRASEVRRKSSRRARLINTPRGAQRRAEWKPDRHNTDPLHYRWRVVRKMLTDLNGDS